MLFEGKDYVVLNQKMVENKKETKKLANMAVINLNSTHNVYGYGVEKIIDSIPCVECYKITDDNELWQCFYRCEIQNRIKHPVLDNSIESHFIGYVYDLNQPMVDNTFIQDFLICERFGVSAIRDTYKLCRKEWQENVDYACAFSVSLNHLIWHYWKQKNNELGKLYNELWLEFHNWCLNHFKTWELTRYLRVTD